MMRASLSILGLSIFLFGAVPNTGHALSADDILGTWKIISFVRNDPATGHKIRPLGDNPSGYLIIRPHHLAFMLVADGRKHGDGDAAFTRSILAYAGDYALHPDSLDPDGLKMTIHVAVSGDEVLTGTDLGRYAAVSGNRLSLRSQPGPNASMLIFERAGTTHRFALDTNEPMR
jgi:hypothetical protein